ncbi:hypothetical protein Tco_1578831 [Tanacetum coccineum]
MEGNAGTTEATNVETIEAAAAIPENNTHTADQTLRTSPSCHISVSITDWTGEVQSQHHEAKSDCFCGTKDSG